MPALKGRCILLVEDEALVAMLAEEMLTEASAAVEIATSPEEALRILSHGPPPDAAVLDVNLGNGRTSEPVALALTAAGVRFVVTTGYRGSGVPAAYNGAPLLPKPYGADALVAAVAAVCRPAR